MKTKESLKSLKFFWLMGVVIIGIILMLTGGILGALHMEGIIHIQDIVNTAVYLIGAGFVLMLVPLMSVD